MARAWLSLIKKPSTREDDFRDMVAAKGTIQPRRPSRRLHSPSLVHAAHQKHVSKERDPDRHQQLLARVEVAKLAAVVPVSVHSVAEKNGPCLAAEAVVSTLEGCAGEGTAFEKFI
jgi:hypothetical protein